MVLLLQSSFPGEENVKISQKSISPLFMISKSLIKCISPASEKQEVVEGNWLRGRMVLWEYPYVETVKIWYQSEDYACLLKFREGISIGSTYHVNHRWRDAGRQIQLKVILTREFLSLSDILVFSMKGSRYRKGNAKEKYFATFFLL